MSRHPDLRPLLESTASGSEREHLLGHLRDCATCRRTLAVEDPTRLFALLVLDPVPAGVLDRLSSNIGDALDRAESRRLPGRRLAIASMAATVLLTATLSTYLLLRDGMSQDPRIAADLAAAPAADVAPVVLRSAQRTVEVHAPMEAEVVNFAVGDTQLVMIFDEALDL